MAAEHPERRFPLPRAFLIALISIACIEALVHFTSNVFVNTTALLYARKAAWVEEGNTADVLILGDSTAAAALRPTDLYAHLPLETRILNLALPSAGPSGGEAMLRRHLESTSAPPGLVVLTYNFGTLACCMHGAFENYPLKYLLGFREAMRAARETPRWELVPSWFESQIPSRRHRADILGGVYSIILDAEPNLIAPVQRWLEVSQHPHAQYQFAYGYLGRAERNRRFTAELEEERGWRYFKQAAQPGEKLGATAKFRARGSFFRSRRELLAARRLLAVCERAGIPALILPPPIPRAKALSLRAGEGERQLAAFWKAALEDHPSVHMYDETLVAMDHRFFADRAHVNPSGAARYAATIGPAIENAYRR